MLKIRRERQKKKDAWLLLLFTGSRNHQPVSQTSHSFSHNQLNKPNNQPTDQPTIIIIKWA